MGGGDIEHPTVALEFEDTLWGAELLVFALRQILRWIRPPKMCPKIWAPRIVPNN